MKNKDEIIFNLLINEFVKTYINKSGSQAKENDYNELIDDPTYVDDSVYVPKDIKKKINKWANLMGLSTTKKQ